MSRAWPVPAWARLVFVLSGARPWAARWRLSRQRTAPRTSLRVRWAGASAAPEQLWATVATTGATMGATTGAAAGVAPPSRAAPAVRTGREGNMGGGGRGQQAPFDE